MLITAHNLPLARLSSSRHSGSPSMHAWVNVYYIVAKRSYFVLLSWNNDTSLYAHSPGESDETVVSICEYRHSKAKTHLQFIVTGESDYDKVLSGKLKELYFWYYSTMNSFGIYHFPRCMISLISYQSPKLYVLALEVHNVFQYMPSNYSYYWAWRYQNWIILLILR